MKTMKYKELPGAAIYDTEANEIYVQFSKEEYVDRLMIVLENKEEASIVVDKLIRAEE